MQIPVDSQSARDFSPKLASGRPQVYFGLFGKNKSSESKDTLTSAPSTEITPDNLPPLSKEEKKKLLRLGLYKEIGPWVTGAGGALASLILMRIELLFLPGPAKVLALFTPIAGAGYAWWKTKKMVAQKEAELIRAAQEREEERLSPQNVKKEITLQIQTLEAGMASRKAVLEDLKGKLATKETLLLGLKVRFDAADKVLDELMEKQAKGEVTDADVMKAAGVAEAVDNEIVRETKIRDMLKEGVEKNTYLGEKQDQADRENIEGLRDALSQNEQREIAGKLLSVKQKAEADQVKLAGLIQESRVDLAAKETALEKDGASAAELSLRQQAEVRIQLKRMAIEKSKKNESKIDEAEEEKLENKQ